MKKCQFCAEEVKDEAIKCKHCGSMLTATSIDPMRATDPAKAVTKGLKQKQLHDSLYKMWSALTVIACLIIGFNGHPGWAWSIFFVVAIIVNVWYYRE